MESVTGIDVFEVRTHVERGDGVESVVVRVYHIELRASVQMTASRMGAPAPVLSIVRAGEFKLGSEMTGDDVVVAFEDQEPER